MNLIVRLARMRARSRVRGLLLLLFIAGVLLWSLFQAGAQERTPCAPTDDMITYLEKTHGEVTVADAEFEGDMGSKMVLTRNPATTGWTLLRVWTNGTSCILQGGYGSIAPVYAGLRLG